MKIHEIIEKTKELEESQESSTIAWRFLGSKKGKVFNIAGQEIALSSGDGDYGNMEEWRMVIEWMADQFGGSVKWED